MTNENTNLKYCNGCKEYRSKGDYNKDVQAVDGLGYRCRPCRKKYRRQEEVKERTTRYNKRYASKNPEKMREKDRRNSLKRFWGMTLEQFETMRKKQGGGCAICGKTESNPNKSLCIDHDHTTGKIRGLLCDNHNRAMGLFKDSIDDMIKAINYLKSYRS